MNVEINISYVGEAKKKRLMLDSMLRHSQMLSDQLRDLRRAIDSTQHEVNVAEREVNIAIYNAVMEALK